MTKELLIFDPLSAPLQAWTCVNDGVMGGVSRSEAWLNEQQALCWQGDVSLENNGGFASVRHVLSGLDLSWHQGISLLLKGDEKVYKLNLANDLSSGSPRFQARFTTQQDLQLLHIPFNSLSPSVRGQKVDASFDPSSLKMAGFLIADRQKGPFSLTVIRISAYV